MRTIRTIIILLFVLFYSICYGQKKFKVEANDTGTWKQIYSLVDEQGKLIQQLDTAKYYVTFRFGQYGHFAIFGKKDSPGWTAIDANEKELFKVYNTSFGEPTPDELIENKIRIVDGKNKIGFANNKGEVIIKPQFEIVSSFHNGKAIIGTSCKTEPWSKHANESGCNHYSIICRNHGYINEKGVVMKLGNYSYDQIAKEIGWKEPDYSQ
ncbi:MAG: WG repeat-containing protein [Bacteroidota bacterium]